MQIFTFFSASLLSYNVGGLKCVSSNCELCSDHQADVCLRCIDGYDIDIFGACNVTDNASYLELEHSNFLISECSKENCATCEHFKFCDHLKSRSKEISFKISKRALSQCEENNCLFCKRYNSTCIACDKGFFLDYSKCQPCSENCAFCIDSTHCSVCESDSNLTSRGACLANSSNSANFTLYGMFIGVIVALFILALCLL